ncbi:MAG: DNA polymerase III subunit beta [Proteobacteria bacterium]|nr:DNA polymerase III subunit beta [Pseudomonadota bacterium]
MKIIVEKEKLKSLLDIVQGIIEKRTTMPILNTILIETNEKVNIKATNLEKSIITNIDAEIIEKGSTCIPAKKFYEIIKSLNEEKIEMQIENNHLKIKAGKSQFKIFTQDPLDFPKIKTLDQSKRNTLKKEDLQKSIEKIEYAIYQDESRLSLNGIYIHNNDGKLRFVASDGYRLSYNEIEYDGEAIDVLIPKKAIGDIKKICRESKSPEIKLSIESNMACFETENITFITRLNEAKFPNYKDVIPDNKMRAFINKSEIINSIEKLLTIADEMTKSIVLNIDETRIKMSTANNEVGEAEDEIETKYEGENLTIGFNGEFLLAAIKHVDSDTIEMSFKDSQTAVIISGDTMYKALVMPIRI